jgi:RNA polymerase I-specific transcription initiation factor RRN3
VRRVRKLKLAIENNRSESSESGLQALDVSLPESSSAPLTRRIVYDRIHHLLRHLLTLVPTLPTTLQPLLVQHFPHKRQSQASQITYIRNMLRITNYCPEIADSLLSTIIDRAIQIDVSPSYNPLLYR